MQPTEMDGLNLFRPYMWPPLLCILKPSHYIHCYSLNLKCPPNAHVLKVCSPKQQYSEVVLLGSDGAGRTLPCQCRIHQWLHNLMAYRKWWKLRKWDPVEGNGSSGATYLIACLSVCLSLSSMRCATLFSSMRCSTSSQIQKQRFDLAMDWHTWNCEA